MISHVNLYGWLWSFYCDIFTFCLLDSYRDIRDVIQLDYVSLTKIQCILDICLFIYTRHLFGAFFVLIIHLSAYNIDIITHLKMIEHSEIYISTFVTIDFNKQISFRALKNTEWLQQFNVFWQFIRHIEKTLSPYAFLF